MAMNRRMLITWVLVSAGVVLVVVAALSGLGSSSSSGSADASTALGGIDAAESALATSAPDAKLLVIQMISSVATTDTPMWAYLFGSPSTDTAYLVYVSDGIVMASEEYGEAGLTEEQWAAVPEIGALEIDSDKAFTSALEASGASGTPSGYYMGLITYKSEEDTSTTEPMAWNVWFDPGSSGATTNLILVDATSGDVTVTDSE